FVQHGQLELDVAIDCFGADAPAKGTGTDAAVDRGKLDAVARRIAIFDIAVHGAELDSATKAFGIDVAVDRLDLDRAAQIAERHLAVDEVHIDVAVDARRGKFGIDSFEAHRAVARHLDFDAGALVFVPIPAPA